MSQLKIQLFGILLASATAMGCLAYEKLVKACSYGMVGFLTCLAYVPFFLGAIFLDNQMKEDLLKLKEHKWAVIIYLASGITGPIWWYLVRHKGIMTGAVFEVKYIFILLLFALVCGDRDVNTNTILGTMFAMASIYFISK